MHCSRCLELDVSFLLLPIGVSLLRRPLLCSHFCKLKPAVLMRSSPHHSGSAAAVGRQRHSLFFSLFFCPQPSFEPRPLFCHVSRGTSSPTEPPPPSTSCFSLSSCPAPSLVTQEVSGASGASPATSAKANLCSAAAAFLQFSTVKSVILVIAHLRNALLASFGLFIFLFRLFFSFPPLPRSHSSVVTAGSL